MLFGYQSGREALEVVLASVDNRFRLGWKHRLCDLGLLNELLVKVGEVLLLLGLVGGHELTLQHFLDIKTSEPLVSQDFIDAPVGSQALLLVLVEEAKDQILGVLRHGDLVSLWVGEIDL